MDAEFLLYPVFEALRRQGVPLGISEYLIALKMMRESGGRNLENRGSLQRLCRLLWAKSPEDQELFDRVFDREITMKLEGLPQPAPQLPKEELFGTPSQFEQQSQQKPSNQFEREAAIQTDQLGEEEELPHHQGKLQRLPFPNEIFQHYTFDEPPNKYQLTPQLPIDRRDMIGIWRHLRKLQREGPLEELDVQGTINSICRDGLFIRPMLQPRRRNQARLVLLIDQSSSMEPFGLIVDVFIESVLRSGLHQQTRLFYFGNCPETYLFETPKLTKAKPLAEVLSHDCKGQSVLVVSDAGAARGEYTNDRVEKTKEFIRALHENTYLYAWLNPMPIERWSGTTAEDIRELVPMYHLNRDGVDDAVNILRGYPFPQEIRFHV